MSRKRHILTLAALILAAACVFAAVWASSSLNARAADAAFKKTWSEGDPSAAEGLSLTSYIQSENTLLWKNDLVFDGGEQSLTEQSYRTNAPYEALWGCDFRAFINVEGTQELQELQESMQKECEVGSRISSKIMLKDYFKYYPLSVQWSVGGENYQTVHYSGYSDLEKAVNDLFRVPVNAADYMILTCEKHSQNGGGSTGTEPHYATGYSVAGYLVGSDMVCVTVRNDYPDASGLSGPSSMEAQICSFPVKKLDKAIEIGGGKISYVPASERTELLWELPEGAVYEACGSMLSRDAVIVVYSEGSVLKAAVCDAAGKAPVEIVLLEDSGTDASCGFYQKEDYAVVQVGSEAFCCIWKDATGWRASSFPAPDLQLLAENEWYGNLSVAFHKKDFAVAGTIGGSSPSDFRASYRGVFLAVLSADGPVYQAKYGSDAIAASAFSDHDGYPRAASIYIPYSALKW